jgi:SAM-dependent methyltransferase
MLRKAGVRLERFDDRFEGVLFDLGGDDWRRIDSKVKAVVTSLAVHHLIGQEKANLFTDVYQMLAPGGSFIIADIVDPNHHRSKILAAAAYDAAVLERSIAFDGHTGAFDFFRREGWNIFHELDPDDIDKPSPLYDQLLWLDAAGFDSIDVFWMRAGHAIFGGWKREENETEDV